jgi:electron transport complex protein RnfG
MKNTYIGQAWLVLSVAVVFGSGLAGVQAWLSGRIAENKLNETYDQIPNLVIERDTQTGDIIARADKDKTQEWVSQDGKIAYKAFSADGEHIGWVIKGAGKGFQDNIELLVGLNPDASRVLGMFVLDQKETPALGDKIREEDFRGRFVGRNAAYPVYVGAAPSGATPQARENKIEPISGATISSESVCEIVNNAVSAFREGMDKLEPAAEGEQPNEQESE